MTDKELIQALRKSGFNCRTPGVISVDILKTTAADRLEALIAENAELQKKVELLVENGYTMRKEIQKLIFEKSGLELKIGLLEGMNDYLREAVKMQWISTRERLPEHGTECIVVVKYKFDFEKDFNFDVDVAEFVQEDGYIDNHWNTTNDWYDGQQYMHVTRWMPLPELPGTEGVE